MSLSNDKRRFIADLADGSLRGQFPQHREMIELLGDVCAQFEAASKYILWNCGTQGLNGTTANTAAATIGTGSVFAAKLAMCDNDNVINGLSQGNTVTVTLTGTATNKKIDIGDGYVAGPVVVTLVDGEASFNLKGDFLTTQTLIATLSSGPAGKTLDSTLTLTAP